MRNQVIISIIVLFILTPQSTAQLSSQLDTAIFSEDLVAGETYEWRIDNYQVGSTRVETSNPNAFDFIHDSTIELTILKDPSSLDLAELDNLTISDGFSDYFELKYDDKEFDFSYAAPLYIWVFPSVGKNADGGDIDLITNFWIYNVYNILRNGETLDFNSSLPAGDVDSEFDSEDNVITVNFDVSDEDASILAEIEKSTGILLELSYVSNNPDFRIEIDRRGGGSGFLPISMWFVVPLVLLPIIIKKIRN